MRLEGKVALITGGGSGMGKVASELFAREGANVVLTDVNDEAGRATASAIGDGALFVHADVSRETDARTMVSDALVRFGRLDVLYNNAGVMLPDDGSVQSTDEAIWDTTHAVNVMSISALGTLSSQRTEVGMSRTARKASRSPSTRRKRPHIRSTMALAAIAEGKRADISLTCPNGSEQSPMAA